MVYEHNKNNENVIGRIGKAVGPNGQNERFCPLKIQVNKKGGWGGLNIDQS